MAHINATVKKMTASGVVDSGAGYLIGLLVGSDYANDPIISVYDNNAAAAGDEIIPTTKIDASAFGFNGFMPGSVAIPYTSGLYLALTVGGGGSAEVLVYYRSGGASLPSKMIR